MKSNIRTFSERKAIWMTPVPNEKIQPDVLEGFKVSGRLGDVLMRLGHGLYLEGTNKLIDVVHSMQHSWMSDMSDVDFTTMVHALLNSTPQHFPTELLKRRSLSPEHRAVLTKFPPVWCNPENGVVLYDGGGTFRLLNRILNKDKDLRIIHTPDKDYTVMLDSDYDQLGSVITIEIQRDCSGLPTYVRELGPTYKAHAPRYDKNDLVVEFVVGGNPTKTIYVKRITTLNNILVEYLEDEEGKFMAYRSVVDFGLRKT